MPITVKWDNEAKTIIRMQRTKPWDWNDFDKGVDESYALVRSVNHTVYIIQTLSDDDTMPPGNTLAHINRMLQLRPNNAGPTVNVGTQAGTHGFRPVIFSTIRKAKKSAEENLVFVSSLEEAYAIVGELQRQEEEEQGKDGLSIPADTK